MQQRFHPAIALRFFQLLMNVYTEITFFNDRQAGLLDSLRAIADCTFARITYDEAIQVGYMFLLYTSRQTTPRELTCCMNIFARVFGVVRYCQPVVIRLFFLFCGQTDWLRNMKNI
jgi:hypothetical protein